MNPKATQNRNRKQKQTQNQNQNQTQPQNVLGHVQEHECDCGHVHAHPLAHHDQIDVNSLEFSIDEMDPMERVRAVLEAVGIDDSQVVGVDMSIHYIKDSGYAGLPSLDDDELQEQEAMGLLADALGNGHDEAEGEQLLSEQSEPEQPELQAEDVDEVEDEDADMDDAASDDAEEMKDEEKEESMDADETEEEAESEPEPDPDLVLWPSTQRYKALREVEQATDENEWINPREIGEQIGVSSSTVSAALCKSIDDGLVERREREDIPQTAFEYQLTTMGYKTLEHSDAEASEELAA